MYSNMNISLASISDSIIEERNVIREAKRELKKDITNIGSRSQFHGLNRIIKRHILLRVIWSLFFLASMGLCAYTIITNIQQYFSFGVNTLVKVVPQNNIPLPTISVCNQNPFITMEANEYIEKYYLDTYNVSLISYENFDRLIFNNVVPNDIEWLFYRTFDPQFNQTLRDSFGFTFEEQNVFCRLFFNDCYRPNYRTFYHAKYGNCFIFNSGLQDNGSNINLLYQVAEEYGLEMGIFVGEAENPKYFYNMKFDNGIVMMIGDQNSTALDQEGILVSPGRWANIALSKSTSQNLPQPYNDCQDSNTFNTALSNEMKRLEISYDRHNCFTLCKQMIIIEKLGCYDMRYPRLFNSTPCNDKSSFEKIKTINLDLIKCQSECPFECESTILDWDISYALFPNKYTSKIINATNGESLKTLFTNGSYDYLDIQQAVAGFFVYYDPLTITEISQSPSTTLADLFSNIGGALGLFLGISLLSLVELLEMGCVSLETLIKFGFSKTKNPKPKKTYINEENDEDKVGILSDIRKELKRTGISTTLHGVPNMLLSNRKYVKIVWLMFTLVSIGFCIFMIVRGISSYLQFKVVSNIRQVPQQNITFPSIQICNPNFLATREASTYMNEYYLKNEGVNITNLDEYFDYLNITWFSSFNWPFTQTFLPNFNMTTRRSLGYSLEDLLLVCEFNSKPCNLSWFEWYSHPIFGNCYRFNTGYLNGVPNAIDLLTIDKPNSGLYMELFTGLPDDYYNFYFREWEYNSVNMYISSQGHLPMDKFGRPFKAGSAASVKLYHSHYANLPDPYSNCQYAENMNTDLVKNILNANISYDRYNCVAFCQQILGFNITGVYFMSYPNPFGLRFCETYDECMAFKEAPFDDSVCSLMCPPECEQYTYEYDVSLSDFPSINYAYKLINDRHDHFSQLFQTKNITYDMLKKSVSSFHFYFDELVVNDITASPSVEFVDLISNIGGIFGLFVGLSVLSFVEIIELTFNITNIIIKVKRLRKINALRNQNNHILSY